MLTKTLETRDLLGGGAIGSPLNPPEGQKISVQDENFRLKSLCAFSVSEVLIVLVIIGVICAFLIPAIKLRVEEKVLVSKYKKIYSMLNSTYNESIRKYGAPQYWDLEGDVGFLSVNFVKYLVPAGLKGEYIEDDELVLGGKWLHNKNKKEFDFLGTPIYRLPDGTLFMNIWVTNAKCKFQVEDKNNLYLKELCGDMRVDLNGEKGPNTYGVDQFRFRISKRGIIPIGIRDDIDRPVKDYCNPKTGGEFNGYSCGAWMLEKETMPWLYGKQIDW